MLEVLARNNNFSNENVRLFEMATIYLPSEDAEQLPEERKVVTLGMYGDADFYTLKGVVENVLALARIEGAVYASCSDDATYHPGRCARVIASDGTVLGIFGQVHPLTAANYGMAAPVYAAALDFEEIFAHRAGLLEYKPLPKFPATTRDLAVLAPKTVTVAEISDIIEDKAKGILESVKLFDVYSGAQIPDGFISLAFALVFRAADRTLNDEEIDSKIKKIVKTLAEIGVSIRS
jgi:phenylalanyl-tRNA synthetase beta chain